MANNKIRRWFIKIYLEIWRLCCLSYPVLIKYTIKLTDTATKLKKYTART